MTWVEYKYGKHTIKKEVDEIRAFLGDKSGGYLMLSSDSIKSRYDGLFSYLDNMFKIVDSFGFGFDKVINHLNHIDFEHSKLWFTPEDNCFVLDTSKPITLDFDIRKSFDLKEWGRHYEISVRKNTIVIRFTKKTDKREDDSDGELDYQLFVAIKHSGKHEFIEKWVEKQYEYDKHRGSAPFSRHVYRALKIDAKKIVIATGASGKKAIDKVEKSYGKPSRARIGFKKSKNEDISFAYNFARVGYEELFVNKRIFAGYPWFFQFWTRDEAVSVGALIAQKRYDLAKKILFNQLNYIQADGRITNRIPESTLTCADGNGWNAFRLKQLLKLGKLDDTEKIFLKAKLQYIFDRFEEKFVHGDFVQNQVNATWMDTNFGGDNRNGARIEIQAMHMAFYNLIYELTKQQKFKDLELHLKEKVRREFWNKKLLADGLGDFTIRPNIFIAYYIYPELLSKQEWIKCFENSIPNLWLDWGGLSSIDKNHKLFRKYYSGEDTASYHRGDSWYWINNLAAICMYRLDKARFKRYIDGIFNASTREILWKGATGRHAEISSAAEQKGQGCLSQAWSCATYIEMIKEFEY